MASWSSLISDLILLVGNRGNKLCSLRIFDITEFRYSVAAIFSLMMQ